jgi:hypothetical protein
MTDSPAMQKQKALEREHQRQLMRMRKARDRAETQRA